MHGLSREAPEACSEEEKPRRELAPVGRLSEEAARFLGEIQQNGARVEKPAPSLPPGPSGSLRNTASALVATEVAWRYRFHSRPLEARSI